jgi:hypothetical protein
VEELKKLLGDDLYKQVEAKLGTEKKYFFAEGEFIPKSRFDEVNTQNKDLKQQVADRDKQITDLGPKAKGNEDMTKKIEELQAANKKAAEDYEAKILARDRDHALDGELRNVKVKNSKAVSALLDHTKITFKDGKIEGLNEQVEALKKSDAYLFDEANPGVPPKAGGKVNPPANPSDQFADLRNM